jgi:hypothetical protein
MEVQEQDLENSSTPFIWCVECREPVYLSVQVLWDANVVQAKS